MEGFQEIMRALPMTRAGDLELPVNDAHVPHLQHEDYGSLLVRTFVDMPVPKMGVNGGERHERTEHTERPVQHRSLPHFLLSKADAFSASYSHERKDDLADYCRDKMLTFLTSADVVAAIGRRKCHEAALFFETMNPPLHRVPDSNWSALSAVLTHLLGEEVQVVQVAPPPGAKPGILLLIPGPRNTWREQRAP